MPIPFFLFEAIYEQLCRRDWDTDTGKLPPFMVVRKELVLSALAQPFASGAGVALHPTVPAKAAVLFRGLVKNHGLGDGNKRAAVTVLGVFLLANAWLPTYSNRQLYLYARRVAGHNGNYPVAAIERWIRRHARLASEREVARARRQNRRLIVKYRLMETAFDPDSPDPESPQRSSSAAAARRR